jgi:threonine dehydrogenase-like Zn-dependent dehydrogenase
MELLANGYQWLVAQGGLRPGQRLLIQGCGPQGLAALLIAGRTGAIDIAMTGLASDTGRLGLANEMGARVVVVDPTADRATQVAATGGEFDVVLDVTGDPRAVATAPDHLRPQGTLVLASIVGKGVEVPFLTDDLAYREIRIQGVLSKDTAAVLAAEAITEHDPAIRGWLERFVTHVFPLDQGAQAIGARAAGLPGFVKAAVRPDA